MAHLIGMSGPVKGQKFELDKDRITVGRAVNNDIVIRDEAVSSQHCYISRRAGTFVLHDLNSTNGTMLNMQPVKDEVTLQSKQVIQVGSSELMFEGDGQEAASTISTVADVVVEKAPSVSVPKTFSSVSPFGARNKKRKGLWLSLVIFFGIIALLGIIWLFMLLLKLGK